jgi:SAM-dependent methyltransferase
LHGSTFREMSKFAATLPRTVLRIADVGSLDVNGTYKSIFSSIATWTYVGMDLCPGPNVDVVLRGENDWSNVSEESFDVVISGQTLEHTRKPWQFVRQLARLAKPGGTLCVIAPYQWIYHPHPIDCWRVYPDGMRALLEDAGLSVRAVYTAENSPNPDCKGDTVGIALKDMTQ